MEHGEISIGTQEIWNRTHPVTLADADRAYHLYLIGKSGMGKTTLMREMLRQDIAAGKGCGLIDPHGDIAESLLDLVPRHRIDDVVYLDPTLQKYRVVINPFYKPPQDENARALIGYNVISTFKHLFHENWSDTRLQYILTNVVLALLDAPDHLRPTMASIPIMLLNERYRNSVVANVRNAGVRRYFEYELGQWDKRYLDEAIGPVQNRIGQFLTHPSIRQTFGAWKPTVDFRKIIDEGKILIVRLPKGIFGEEPTNYFGSFTMGGLQVAAMQRATIAEQERRPFYLFVDEFQNFGTDATTQIFSEARKFKLHLTVAHQYLDQLQPDVRNAVFGNVGNFIAFRVKEKDAALLAEEVDGVGAGMASNLGRGEVIAQLLSGGLPRSAILGRTHQPAFVSYGNAANIQRNCRRRYCRRSEKTEKQVMNWLRRF